MGLLDWGEAPALGRPQLPGNFWICCHAVLCYTRILFIEKKMNLAMFYTRAPTALTGKCCRHSTWTAWSQTQDLHWLLITKEQTRNPLLGLLHPSHLYLLLLHHYLPALFQLWQGFPTCPFF